MKKNLTRILCTLLMLAMLVSVFSCASSSDPEDNTADTAADSAAEGSNEGETTVSPEEALEFEFKQFGGDMTFMSDQQIMFGVCDIYAEKDSEEPMESAIFNRNIWIKDNFDVNVKEIQTEDVLNYASAQFKAGTNDCDAYASKTTYASQMSTKGYLANLFGSNLDGIVNLEHPWWDAKAVEGLQVSGKLYYATGDLFTIDNSATYIMMFNKTLITDKGLENPYLLVDNMEWTVEKMKTMGEAVVFAKDSTADYYKYNSFGFAGGCEMVLAFFYAAGMSSVKDDDGELVYAIDAEKTAEYLTWAHDTLYDKEFSAIYHELPNMDAKLTRDAFSEGRVLFYGEVLGTVQGLRESDVVFGVIPFPMYTSTQNAYYSMVNNVAHVVSVPANVANFEKSGMLIEAMSYESKILLTPAYYDITLLAKGFRDEESEPMLDLILKNRIYDLGYVFSWGQMLEPNFYNIAKAGTGTASSIEKQKKAFDNQMKKTLKAYEKYDS